MKQALIFILMFCSIYTVEAQKSDFFMMNYIATTTPKDSIRVQMDTTNVDQSGWSVLKGSPNFNVKTVTGGNANTITVSSISTSANNWFAQFGNNTLPNNGTATGTVWNYAPNVMKESWFILNTTYNATYPQLKVSGLLTNKTYSLQLTGSLSTSLGGFFCIGDYRVLGNSLYGPLTLDSQPSGVENKTSSITFSSIQPDGTGSIYLYMNASSGNNTATICGFILKEN